jgi:Protein of unknown function (DUF3017)
VTTAVRGLPGNRAFRAARRDIPFLLVLAVLVAGFVYVRIAPQHWLRGVLVIGGDVIAAGLLRLFLPARRAGLLVVRSRAFDTITYLGLGVLVITFGVALPR